MSTDNALVRSQKLLWNGLPESTKGPRPALTLDQIVVSAVELADTEGVEALAMRRLARELGVGTMSLYRYVPGKVELINLMVDRVVGGSRDRFADLGDDWRAVLERSARQGRLTYLRHPWLLQVNLARPILGPGSVADFAATMRGLRSMPLTDREKVAVLTAVEGFVVGTVREEILYEKAAEETGLSEEEFWELQRPYLEAAAEGGDFPGLEDVDEGAFDGSWEETFDTGLIAMLDGLELRINSGH